MLHEPVSVDVQPLSNAAGRKSGSFQYLDSGSTAPGEANITSDSSRPWTGIKSKSVYFSMHGCIYIYMYIYIYVYIHRHITYTQLQLYTYIHILYHIYIYTYSSIFTNYDDFVPAKCSFVVYMSYILYIL